MADFYEVFLKIAAPLVGQSSGTSQWGAGGVVVEKGESQWGGGSSEKKNTPKEEPIPVTETNQNPDPQSPAQEQSPLRGALWLAKNYPYEYLTGKHPYRTYVSEPVNKAITESLLKDIIENTPEKYFEWGLRKKHDFSKYENSAAESLISKDPERALVIGIYHSKNIQDKILLLWEGMVKDLHLDSLVGRKFDNMKALMKEIKARFPDYYNQNIQSQDIESYLSGKDPGAKDKSQEHWFAESHTQTYLRGQDIPGWRYSKEYSDINVVEETVKKLIETNPEKYFEWSLNRVSVLKKFFLDACIALIQKNPEKALMLEIFERGHELERAFTYLWVKLMDHFSASKDSKMHINNPPVVSKMKALAGKIAQVDSKFYTNNIKNTFFDDTKFHASLKKDNPELS